MAKRLAKAGNKKFAVAMRKVKPPPEFAYILIWHGEIRRQALRGFHFEPLQLSEIEAYKNLFQLDVDPFDVAMILEIDQLWQAAQPKPGKDDKTGDKKRDAR